MGKRKKEEFPKLTEIPVLENPSKAFCLNCVNSDMRVIKDTLNEAVNLLYAIALKYDIKENTFSKTCKELKKWLKKK